MKTETKPLENSIAWKVTAIQTIISTIAEKAGLSSKELLETHNISFTVGDTTVNITNV